MTDTPIPHVYTAIACVQSALCEEGISKIRKNQAQGYSFRGIDDVYNALSPILAKNGLCILPRMLKREMTEHPSAKGGTLFYVTVEAEFDMVSAKDGSKHIIRTFGEAMDSGDKATNKAMSAAYKYACMQAFAIPTEGDNDADAKTPTPIAKTTSTGQVVSKIPKWSTEELTKVGEHFSEVIRIGGDTGEAEVKKLRNEMKYDAPADVIDAAAKLAAKWQDIEDAQQQAALDPSAGGR
jgi:hypothetical protein